MEERSRIGKRRGRKQTQWDGLFVSEHAWSSADDYSSDPQPMLSADEQQAILDMLFIACDRRCTVFIQSWQERHFHFHRCVVRDIDWERRRIMCEEAGGRMQLAIESITSIHMLD